MTTQQLKHWRVYCETEDTYREWWLPTDASTPTTCPVDTNHTITNNLTSEVAIETIVGRVKIEEETIPTQGFFMFEGFKKDIDGNVGSVTTITKSWPYRISLLEGWFYSQDDQVGDMVEAVVGPETVTGAITAPVSVSDTEISVGDTVIENTAVGFRLNLTDGVNVADLGRVLSIDSANSTVSVETPSSHAFSPASPTYVRQNVDIVKMISLNVGKVRYGFAGKKMGGKTLPPNIPLEIRYINVTGGEKSFSYNIEYIY